MLVHTLKSFFRQNRSISLGGAGVANASCRQAIGNCQSLMHLFSLAGSRSPKQVWPEMTSTKKLFQQALLH